MSKFSYDDLPWQVADELQHLEFELQDGDITQKGYEKKKAAILAPYQDLIEEKTRLSKQLESSEEQHEVEPDLAQIEAELGPEPSAADVTDFLDFLPSPTHSPADSRGATLMEAHQQQQQQQQQAPRPPVNTMTGSPQLSQLPRQPPLTGHPQPPMPGYPIRPNNVYPQQPRPYMMDNNYRPAPMYNNRPPPSHAFDPRMTARPIYNNNYPVRPNMNGYRPSMLPPNSQPGSIYRPQQQQQQQQQPPPPPPSNPPPSQNMYYRPQQLPTTPSPIMSSQASMTHSRSTSLDSKPEFTFNKPYPPSIRQNLDMVMEPESLDWDTASQASWRPGREGSIMTMPKSISSNSGFLDPTIQRTRSNASLGRSRYRDSYMATTFKAIEPPPQPKLMFQDPADQMFLADLAGRQMTPLKGRPIPFDLYDSDNKVRLTDFSHIVNALRYKATESTDRLKEAFAIVDGRGKESATLTWDKLNARAEKIAQTLQQKHKVKQGDRIALIYRKSEVLEFIPALFGCFLAGVTAVPINAAEDLSELSFIISLANIHLILTTDYNHRAFVKEKNVELAGHVTWLKTNDLGTWYPSKKSSEYPPIKVPEIAYIEYAKANNGELKGVTVTHASIMEQCAAFQAATTETIVNTNGNGVEVKPKHRTRQSDVVVSYFEPRQQIGLILSVLQSVYAGNLTIFANGSIVDTPAVWIYVLSKYNATMALADYNSLKFITHYFESNQKEVKTHSKKVVPDLSSLRYLIVDTNIVRPELNQLIADKLLGPLGNTDCPLEVICPVLSLPEHGGKIVSMRDNLGPAFTEESVEHEELVSEEGQQITHSIKTTQSVLAPGGSRDAFACLLDAQALRRNKVLVLAAGAEAKKAENLNEPGRVCVESFGFCMPKTNVAIVDPDTATVCPPDTLGEVWVDSPSMHGGFWALPKHTESIFHARPIVVHPESFYPEVSTEVYLRTGLCGTMIGGRLFILGPYEDRIRQQHLGSELGLEDTYYASELLDTIRKRARIQKCTLFEVFVKRQHLPIVVCESNANRADLIKIADEIDEALIDFHGLRAYAIIFVKENGLPRQKVHGRRVIHSLMTKKYFIHGQLNIRHIKIDVDRTIFNLATNVDPTNNLWLSGMAYDKAIRTGAIIPHPQRQHTGLEQVRNVIDERTNYDVSRFTNMVDILQWRTTLYPEEVAFTLSTLSGQNINTKTYSWRKLSYKSAAVAALLVKKGLKRGSRVLAMIPFGVDYVFCIYACLAIGVIPIPIEPVDPQLQSGRINEFVEQLIEASRDLGASAILASSEGEDVFKNNAVKSALKQLLPSSYKLPETINISKAPKNHKMLGKESGFTVRPEWITSNRNVPAMITIQTSSDGRRLYAHLGHDTILNQCRTQKMTCQMRFQRGIVTTGLGTYDGLGLLHALFCGVYVGCSTVLIPSADFYMNPVSFFESLQRHKVKDAFLTNALVQFAMNRMNANDSRHITLKGVQNLMLANDNRPKPLLYQHMARYFVRHRLDKESINTVYSHAANPMITTRSYMLLEPIALSVDPYWLRQGIVRAMNPEEEAYGILLNDSGIVPSNTMIAIVNPETRTLCPSHVVGEIWVSSDSNAKTFYGLDDASHAQRFEASIAGNDPNIKYFRTGDLGFLWNVRRRVDNRMMQPVLEEGQCLYVLGPINETIYRNGLIHFPIDIELSIERCHPMIPAGGSIVFQYKEEVVAVVSVKSNEYALSAVPLVVNAILEHHSFLVDIVVIVHPNHFPRSRFGDKMRRKALVVFAEKKLTAIYVKRITNQHENLMLPQWTQSQLSLADVNDSGSVHSAHFAQSISDFHSEFDRPSAPQSLMRQDTSLSRTSHATEIHSPI